MGLHPVRPVGPERQRAGRSPGAVPCRERYAGKVAFAALPLAGVVVLAGPTGLQPEPLVRGESECVAAAGRGAEVGAPFAGEEVPQEPHQPLPVVVGGERIVGDVEPVQHRVDSEGPDPERLCAWPSLVGQQTVGEELDVEHLRRVQRGVAARSEPGHDRNPALAGGRAFRVGHGDELSPTVGTGHRHEARLFVAEQALQKLVGRLRVEPAQRVGEVEQREEVLVGLGVGWPGVVLPRAENGVQSWPQVVRAVAAVGQEAMRLLGEVGVGDLPL